MAVIEQTALIAVPNDYTKKVLESDVRENLVRALATRWAGRSGWR
jgi:hypothetical protein